MPNGDLRVRKLLDSSRVRRTRPVEVWDLTLSMIGQSSNPSLSAKAAESHGLVSFVAFLLQKHQLAFQSLSHERARKGKVLLEAAKAALQVDTVFKAESRMLSREELQRAFWAYSRFLKFYVEGGGPVIPKCHFMMHLIQRASHKGNPRLYSTYRDESFNGTIAKVARSCHRRTWQNAIHFKCRAIHQKKFKDALARLA